MIIEKKKTITDVVYKFKQKEDYVSSVQAFKRRSATNEMPTIYVKGFEQISETNKNEFLQAISIEMGKGKIEQAKASFLSTDNKTWFDIVQKEKNHGSIPYGEYTAYNLEKEPIAKLMYVGRKALISDKTELLVSISNNAAPKGVYEQLFDEFMKGVVAEINQKENKNQEKGLVGFIAVESNNNEAKKLVESIEKSPKSYACESCSYFGQNEEEYSESIHYFRSLPKAVSAKPEISTAKAL